MPCRIWCFDVDTTRSHNHDRSNARLQPSARLPSSRRCMAAHTAWETHEGVPRAGIARMGYCRIRPNAGSTLKGGSWRGSTTVSMDNRLATPAASTFEMGAARTFELGEQWFAHIGYPASAYSWRRRLRQA